MNVICHSYQWMELIPFHLVIYGIFSGPIYNFSKEGPKSHTQLLTWQIQKKTNSKVLLIATEKTTAIPWNTTPKFSDGQQE